MWKPCAIALLVMLAAGSARAAVIWDESGGDLSGNRLAPSTFNLATGSNNLIGSVQGPVTTGDLDYVSLVVPANTTLAHIMLVSYTSTDQIAFIGAQAGATFTEPNLGTNVANLLGYTHFGPGGAVPGTDILDDIGAGAGAQGFVPPLPAGQYTFWIQQAGAALTQYNFDFQVEAVPEPASVLLAGIGGAAALAMCVTVRRRSRRAG